MRIVFLIFTIFASVHTWALEDIYHQSKIGDHEVRILEDGPAAFIERLNLINSATTTLDLEYFIFRPDLAGKQIVLALKEKAKQGVKIRILIDKSPLAPPLGADVAFMLSLYGIEIKYFNPITIFSLGRAFHRTHRKFIIADGKRMITGGRNIGEEYYLEQHNFSFVDRDIYVTGPIVESVKDTFLKFWEHKISEFPKKKKYHRHVGVNVLSGEEKIHLRQKRLKKALEFILISKKGNSFLDKMHNVDAGNYLLAPTLHCGEMEFATDLPDPKKESRQFADIFYKELEGAQKNVLMETPYFITLKRDKELLENLLKKNIQVTLVTNSTKSNNHPMVSNVLNRVIKSWVQKGMKAFFVKGTRPVCLYCDPDKKIVRSEEIVYGLHAKSTVIDDSTSMFITFNMDPQSQKRSIEMGLFCHKGPELAQELSSLINAHKEVAFSFDNKGQPDNGMGLLQGTTFWQKFFYYMRVFPSYLMAPIL